MSRAKRFKKKKENVKGKVLVFRIRGISKWVITASDEFVVM